MQQQGKYVILRGHGPVLFGEGILHKDATFGKRVVSAGFFKVSADGCGEIWVHCYGDSQSLGIGGDPGDEARIKKLLTGGG